MHQGAKGLIGRRKDLVLSVEIENASVDLDTPAQLERLKELPLVQLFGALEHSLQ